MLEIERLGTFNGLNGVQVTEHTGTQDIYNVDPVTGKTGVKTGVFYLSNEMLETLTANPDKYRLQVRLSHDGNEFNRILTPDRVPYIDLFGMFVYMETEIVSTITKIRDYDERYDIRQPVPWSMENDHFRNQFHLKPRTTIEMARALQSGA